MLPFLLVFLIMVFVAVVTDAMKKPVVPVRTIAPDDAPIDHLARRIEPMA
jgi:hypothetical protein